MDVLLLWPKVLAALRCSEELGRAERGRGDSLRDNRFNRSKLSGSE